MTKTANRFLFGALLFTFAAIGIAAAAQSLTPDAIVAGASTYDGQTVSVTGVAKNVRTHTGRYGPISSYDVCATQCVHVFDRSGATVTEGATVTASGVFHAQLQPRGGASGTSSTQHGNFPTTDILVIAAPGSSH